MFVTLLSMKFLPTSINLKNCPSLSFGRILLLHKLLFQDNLTFLFCCFNLGYLQFIKTHCMIFKYAQKKTEFESLPLIFSSFLDSPGPISWSLRVTKAKYCIYHSFATRVSQLKIWHFWVIGIERNVCRCTFNRCSVITQFAKLDAGEQLCRHCTHRKL